MKLVLIASAGHAGFGVTPGKRVPDGSMYEWDFNNATLNHVISQLKDFEEVEVHIVSDPTGKRDVPLKERTDKANAIYKKYLPDINKGLVKVVYVSIHANAYGTGFNKAQGIETYVYTSKPHEAYILANAVHNHLIKETSRPNRGVKTANFYELKYTDMTAILCECGFMTNKEEAELLKSNEYRLKCATGIVNGLVEFYGLKKKKEPVKIAEDTKHYRLVTGTFKGKDSAEQAAKKLKEQFGWLVYVKEE